MHWRHSGASSSTRVVWALIGSLALHHVSLAAAQEIPGVIQGRLLDSQTGNPVTVGVVQLLDTDGGVLHHIVSDSVGRFLIRVPAAGSYGLRAERIGYRSRLINRLTLRAGDTLDVAFSMSAIPLTLDTVLARVRPGQRIRPGEQLIYGRLVDDDTGKPVGQGTVRLVRGRTSVVVSVLTGEDGLFHIVSPRPGPYRLQAERIGYRSAESSQLHVMLGDSIGVDIRLSTEAVLLEPITVTASARPWWNRSNMSGMQDFVRRFDAFSRSGFGDFLTRDSIAKWEKQFWRISDLLLARVPSVRAADSFSGTVTLRRGCHPRYYLNGTPVPNWVITSLSPVDVEAIEVYVSPTMPAELNVGFPCGAVLYWSRVSPHEVAPGRTRWTILGVAAAVSLILFALY